MAVEESIHKAISAGFDQKYAHYARWEHQAETLLDRSFWESLGKTLGWSQYDEEISIGVHKWGYKHYWHRFIDHLAEGKTAEEFFEHLS